MSRWIAMHCSEEADELQMRHPNAFLLLCQIARRAKWKDCAITKLKAGEAFIGDFSEAGLSSRATYRHAQEVLSSSQLATFKGTNKGTVATLLNRTIFSFSPEGSNQQSSHPTTIQQPTNNQPSSHPATTNHTDTSTQIHGYTETSLFAPNGTESDSKPKKTEGITWTENEGFIGITEKDRSRWAEAFPAVDQERQTAAANEWLLRNPAKRKKNPGRFLANWMSRAQERGGDIASHSAVASSPPLTLRSWEQ